MITLNNKTAGNLGPYNSVVLPANGTINVSGSVSPYIASGGLLADVLSHKVSVTYAGKESFDISAAALLMQLAQILNTDSDGAPLSRVKQAPAGWTYQLRVLEFETSNLSGLFNKTPNLHDIGDAVVKFYDANGEELTEQLDITADCVRTVLDIEPPYDYYLIGGLVKIAETPESDVRLSVIGVPDYPAPAGSKIMVQNVNMRFIGKDDKVEADGRASKGLLYNNPVPHTNKLRLMITHPAGQKHKFMLALEVFKV